DYYCAMWHSGAYVLF
nr:immunoglobulin light chain junction region [Macaca mulatta]MOX77849.1 immunoglobulin light chain junction region [Macaca mulatta]MOX77877.1 immunoglobulin light chain junction region [Macaca mulatta]MOX77924.1 immunoglobulin light chain junction region [Macaca mulatta]MOX77997.1 immunoglobulin light chain junction region [Macaca mulatta]